MTFPRSLLSKDEEIALDLVPHWWYITPASIYLGCAVLVGLVAVTQDWPDPLKLLIGLVILVLLGHFGIVYARWRTTNFVVTNERVIERHGLFNKQGIEMPLDRINTVFFNQTVFERMLGAGDLAIESAGETGKQTFSDIRKPNLVQGEIYRRMELFEERKMQRMGQAIAGAQGPPAAAPTQSIPEQIAHLDALRRQGVITDAEFEAKKRQLLDRM